jgi:hypothetical protein
MLCRVLDYQRKRPQLMDVLSLMIYPITAKCSELLQQNQYCKGKGKAVPVQA